MKGLRKSHLTPGMVIFDLNGEYYIDNPADSEPFKLIKALSDQIYFVEDCDDEVDFFIEESKGSFRLYYFDEKKKKAYLQPVFDSYDKADEYMGEVDQNCPVFVRQWWFVEELKTNKQFRKEIVVSDNRWKAQYKTNFGLLNYELPEEELLD